MRLAGTNVDADDFEAQLAALVDSEVMRATAAGDLLLHPVLRSLYRTQMRTNGSKFAIFLHRLLADHYYETAMSSQWDSVHDTNG